MEPAYFFYQHSYTCISTRHAPEHKKWEGPMSSYMLFSEEIQNGTEHAKQIKVSKKLLFQEGENNAWLSPDG